jgi:hypothetical protein
MFGSNPQFVLEVPRKTSAMIVLERADTGDKVGREHSGVFRELLGAFSDEQVVRRNIIPLHTPATR